MTNRLLGAVTGMALALTAGAAMAGPVTLEFNYAQGATTYNFGTMTISVRNASSLFVRFDAGNPAGAAGFQVTGFGFDFNPERTGMTIQNPSNAAFSYDMNNLNWIVLQNLNAFPNPANSNTVTKDAFEFGVTEGNANNLNPPGVLASSTDVFYINGLAGLNPYTTNVAALIDNVAIRIQALPDSVNGGSLFLIDGPAPATTGTPVPEPASLALFGLGLAGLGLVVRRRRRPA